MNQALEKIKSICDGIEYSRDVPNEAKEIAKENNIVIMSEQELLKPKTKNGHNQ